MCYNRVNKMNLHFQSFVVDVISWIVFAVIYGKYTIKRERILKKKRRKAYIMISFFALIGGLIATADRSLPEYGFSFYHFFSAAVFSIIYSLAYARRLRRYILSQITSFLKITKLFPFRILHK